MPSPESVEIRKTIQKDSVRDDLTMVQLRKSWEDYAAALHISDNIIQTYEEIGGIQCLWLTTAEQNSHSIIFYIHGGGLTEGSVITHREFASRLSLSANKPVVLLDYSLAPEYPYPAALNEVQSVYKRLIEDRFSPENIYWGADSSGASLALSSLIRLRDDNIPLPSKAFFLSGLFDHSLSGETMTSKKEIDPFTSQDVLEHCNKLYSPGMKLDSPEISPLFNDLSDLPEILLQAGTDEILLSDSIRLSNRLESAGGVVKLEIWESMWHSWHMYNGLPEAEDAINQISSFLDR